MGPVAVLKISFALYCLFAFLLLLVLLYVGKALSRNGLKKIAKVVHLVNWVLITPIVLVGITWLYAANIEPNWLEVKQLVMVSDRFDPKLKDLTIVHLTDLHVDHFGYREKKVIQIVNSMHPDIILLGGDFVNKKSGISPCSQLLIKLKASKAIIAIMGNIDYCEFPKEVKAMLEELKIPCLRNEGIKIGLGGKNNLWIVGISSDRERPEYIEEAFTMIPLRDTKVMLVHSPDIVDIPIVETLEPDLILAGHTHGGQLGIAAIRKFSDYVERSAYMAGFFKAHGLNLYVNRGIGTKGKNIRFFCRPEIVVVRLKKK